MSRKAQISVFIVIALLIVGAIIIVYAFRERISSVINAGKGDASIEISEINSVIESCAEQRAIDAIRLIGLQGGYVNLLENYLSTNISNIAYGYYNGKNTLASKKTIQDEINYYVELTTRYCIEDGDFPAINITIGKPTSVTEIQDNQVLVKIKLPLSVSKGARTISMEGPYEIQVPIRLGEIYSTAEFIINEEIKNPDNIELSELSNLSYYITIIPVTDFEIIYIITDEKSALDDGIPYSFLFANKFIIKN